MSVPRDDRAGWEDADLLAAVAARDGSAFSAFYRRHLAEVLAYLVRETGDTELAADLGAEVFAAVLLSAARYESRVASALPWVVGIARHKLLMSWRRGRVEEQLVAATERGVRRRRWRWPWLMRLRVPLRAPTVGIAAGVGAALAASAIAATLTLPASKPKHAAATAVTAGAGSSVRSFTTAGNVPAGFNPESFTAISEFSWWLLGTAPCNGHSCTAIVHTTDGGPTFRRISAPPSTAVGNLRFANRSDGYAFGQQLWSTHNGGRTWTRQPLGSAVDDLQIAGGYAYAIVYSHSRTELIASSIDADNRSRVNGLGSGYLSGLWVQGTYVFIESGSHLLYSDNGGASFSRVGGVHRADNCGYDGGPQALWAVCSTGMAPDEVLLSTNAGNTFTTAALVPNGPIDSFAAATATIAVASGQGPLYRTADAGRSWTPVAAPSANWIYLGFTDATHGVAIGGFGKRGQQYRLYYTTDAGVSYHLVPIGP